jgi:hypothetical protein
MRYGEGREPRAKRFRQNAKARLGAGSGAKPERRSPTRVGARRSVRQHTGSRHSPPKPVVASHSCALVTVVPGDCFPCANATGGARFRGRRANCRRRLRRKRARSRRRVLGRRAELSARRGAVAVLMMWFYCAACIVRLAAANAEGRTACASELQPAAQARRAK